MLINKKEYNNFISKYHETYFNLEIYPVLNELETIAGLMSDLAEMYTDVNYIIVGNPTSDYNLFITDNLKNFNNDKISAKRIAYYDSVANESNFNNKTIVDDLFEFRVLFLACQFPFIIRPLQRQSDRNHNFSILLFDICFE